MSAPLAWERLGRIIRSDGQRDWMRSHAQMAHAEDLGGSLARIYFTSRDAQNRSHIAWLVIDLEQPDQILELAGEPLMSPGPLGRFDDCGVMSSWMVKADGERRFYVIGWNVRTPAPFHISIGLAIGPSEGAPRIDHRLAGPVLDRNPANPYYVSCPCVVSDGDGWRMWCLSGLDWKLGEAGPASRYTVWHARSGDGVGWISDPEACLGFEHPGELAIARPCVVRDGDLWRMWNSYRGEGWGYRVGYAESRDGATWRRRDDHLNLSPSGSGFDSEMACYPFVFDQMGERWMLYSGDGYGQAGMGLARLNDRRAS
jgi:hypothetical protein